VALQGLGDPLPRFIKTDATDWEVTAGHVSADNWIGSAPPAKLVESFHATPLRSATECAALREFALSRGMALLDAEESQKFIRTFGARAEMALISVPTISSDGAEALALTSTVMRGGLGGRLFATYLKLEDGEWKIAGRRPLGFS
jgi:hypothetical protein